ncbi:MAG: SAM-dependent chlorinase/fluorinase [Cyanobacteria bacterium P01_H01_bin.15]
MTETNRLITLLTDFGDRDVYVGVMKGVIASINPRVTVIDLTHQIPPQSISTARFQLLNAFPYFPGGTVHLAVIDPGVGNCDRKPVAIACRDSYLVGPDNGLFSGVCQQFPISQVVELNNSRYWRTQTPSTTFHGRDIFAPVAAHLARGVPLADLGATISQESLQTLTEFETEYGAGFRGQVQHIDHFGNLITTLPSEKVPANAMICIKQQRLTLGGTYSDQPKDQLVAIIGSHGWLEIAVNQGSAAQKLDVKVGAAVWLEVLNAP